MRNVSVAFVAFIAVLQSGLLFAQQSTWLKAAGYDDLGQDWTIIPSKSYLDLGNDSEAVDKLAEVDFVVDSSTSGSSLSLKCASGEVRYLIRSLYFGNFSAAVYEGARGLIVASGSFSQPYSPSKGAIAICLKKAPKSVLASVGFAK